MQCNDKPIGIFDSGVGGLSVLREVRRQLDHENCIYFADQAHIPYGPRPMEEIRRYAVSITRFLLQHEIKLLVVACNTASAAALSQLRQSFPELPIVGMEPAVKPAAQQSKSRRVGVVATQATFQGELFASLVERFAQDVEILEQVCPRLVQQIEAGELDTPETMALLHEYLDPLLDKGMDVLVLGCTHYPFLMPAIRQVVGPTPVIVDPGPAVARQAGRILEERDLCNPSAETGALTCFTTGDPASFKRLAARLVGDPGRVLLARLE
ncbi:MAG: glutamate racemase [Anaerolineales bacterium]|nr:glutamate racemase [Anaerolineales bacterium]